MKLTLHRKYSFAASHRLHSAELSEEENWRAYGKCNNPYGHGHNYEVEVAVSGPVDPETGMIANLADLDRFVQSEVLDAFDHTYLNEEIPAFQTNRADDRKRLPGDFQAPQNISGGAARRCPDSGN